MDLDLAYLTGFWIGDGSVNYGKKPHAVILCTEEDWEKVQEAARRLGLRHEAKPKADGIRELWPGEDFGRALTDMGLALEGTTSRNKRLPPDWQEWRKEARWKLLEGLMDSDGTIDKLGPKRSARGEYSTVSEELGRGIQELCKSLGLNTRLAYHKLNTENWAEGRHKVQFRKPEVLAMRGNLTLQKGKQARLDGWHRKYFG